MILRANPPPKVQAVTFQTSLPIRRKILKKIFFLRIACQKEEFSTEEWIARSKLWHRSTSWSIYQFLLIDLDIISFQTPTYPLRMFFFVKQLEKAVFKWCIEHMTGYMHDWVVTGHMNNRWVNEQAPWIFTEHPGGTRCCARHGGRCEQQRHVRTHKDHVLLRETDRIKQIRQLEEKVS